MTVENAWALVTGAGRGIGRAIAVALSGQGYSLALVARSNEQLLETATACTNAGAPKTAVFATDLTVSAKVEALVERLHGECGPIDVLVNNAGMMVEGNADDGEPDQWERMLALNALTPMRLTRRLAPGMIEREHGTIINLGSVAAFEGMKGAGAYAASKFALRGWSLSCYQRLRLYGIKVMLINPAFVNTDLVSHIPGVVQQHMLQPEDIAQAALFAITSSPACCPEELTLRLTRSAME